MVDSVVHVSVPVIVKKSGLKRKEPFVNISGSFGVLAQMSDRDPGQKSHCQEHEPDTGCFACYQESAENGFVYICRRSAVKKSRYFTLGVLTEKVNVHNIAKVGSSSFDTNSEHSKVRLYRLLFITTCLICSC